MKITDLDRYRRLRTGHPGEIPTRPLPSLGQLLAELAAATAEQHVRAHVQRYHRPVVVRRRRRAGR